MTSSRFLATILTICAILAYTAGLSARSLDVTTPKGRVKITPYSENIFQVTVTPPGSTETTVRSQSAVMKPSGNLEFPVSTSGDIMTLTTPSTLVKVNKTDGKVSFYDANGGLLISEAEGVDNSNPAMRKVSFENPGLGDIFYGAGERGHSLRLNGDTLAMYNRQNYGYTAGDPRIRQMNITVPYFVSSRGYGILFDDFTKSDLVLGEKSIEYLAPQAIGPISYYFINGGGTIAGATRGYMQLTGRQELPPFWALGYITSKYGYHNQAETLGAIDSLKTRGYPVDGIVLDLYWYGKETDMGRLEWDKAQWPDHRKMLADLKDQGVNLVAISQPYINKIGAIDNYNFLVEQGMTVFDAEGRNHDVTTWVGDAGMFDVSNPATRQWLWNRYRDLTLDGIAGWWGDLGEPEVHPSTIRHHNGLTAEQYHNVYGNEWSRLIYEGFKQEFPEERLMLLMRGGTAGLQRYNVFPWSTDVSRSWGGFQPQVNIMLNSGLSGLGYMSSDIGGFAVDPENPTDPELYVRWLQMGAFTPTLRTHAQLKPEPYHYPEMESITKKVIKDRYRWLPYNYTLAYENAAFGYPLARPLNFMDSSIPAEAASLNDEYLWGQNVLVAPVMEAGARERKVWFPAGTWINLNDTRMSYQGDSWADVKAPLDQMPIFVKAGAFLPLYEQEIENVGQYDLTVLTVDYFMGEGDSEYVLFDDDRHSPDSLDKGEYLLTTFRAQASAEDLEISVVTSTTDTTMSSDAGTPFSLYEWMPGTRYITLNLRCLPAEPKAVSLCGVTLKKGEGADEWQYDAESNTATLTVPFMGLPIDIKAVF